MVVRLSSQQTERAQQLSDAMSQITTAIRLARSDRSSSPQLGVKPPLLAQAAFLTAG
jgi:hypothetical protein